MAVGVDGAGEERRAGEPDGACLILSGRHGGDATVGDVHGEPGREATVRVDEIRHKTHQGGDSNVARTPRPALRGGGPGGLAGSISSGSAYPPRRSWQGRISERDGGRGPAAEEHEAHHEE